MVAIVPLSGKRGRGLFALVDDEDWDYISQWKWYLSEGKHAVRSEYLGEVNGKPKKINIWMHRVINNTPPGMMTDHKDQRPLNNQKNNLRSCTHAQNVRNRGPNHNNTSGFKGVAWFKRTNKWTASITKGSKRLHLGYYDTPEQAARAYNLKSLELHGEFSCPNIL